MEFACDSCDKTFKARYLLNRHLVTHTRVRNYLCPICGEAFLQSSALNRHTAGHEKRLAYRCNECGKGFNRSSTRDVHQASHAAKTYICESCGKSFHQQSTLKTHKLIHTNTKPFPCCYCEKTFRQHSNLRVHISRWHRGTLESVRNDTLLSRKKEKDTHCSPRLRQDLRREKCMNGYKQAKRCHKEKCLFTSESSQVCDADIVNKSNSGSCATIQCNQDIGKCRYTEASNTSNKETRIADLSQNRTSVPALNDLLQTAEHASKTSHNSILVPAKNKLQSNSDVEYESENEEHPSVVNLLSDVQEAERLKSCNSAVYLNAKKDFDSRIASRQVPSSTPHCKDVNDRRDAFTGDKTSCHFTDASTSAASNSAGDQRVADEISSTSGNHGKVEVSSKDATATVSNYSVPAQKHPLPIWVRTNAINTKQMEVSELARQVEKIPHMSDAIPLSFSVSQSSKNFHTDHSSTSGLVSTTLSRWDAQLSPEESNNNLPNVENMITNVFKSCRQTTSLISPLATTEQSTVPSKQKIASKTRSGDFSSSKKRSDKHLRAKASATKKSEKVIYLKLFTPEKPVKEFIWSCGLK